MPLRLEIDDIFPKTQVLSKYRQALLYIFHWVRGGGVPWEISMGKMHPMRPTLSVTCRIGVTP